MELLLHRNERVDIPNRHYQNQVTSCNLMTSVLHDFSPIAGNQAKLHDVTLSDLGITAIQSHRWQLETTVPEAMFEKYIRVVIP